MSSSRAQYRREYRQRAKLPSQCVGLGETECENSDCVYVRSDKVRDHCRSPWGHLLGYSPQGYAESGALRGTGRQQRIQNLQDILEEKEEEEEEQRLEYQEERRRLVREVLQYLKLVQGARERKKTAAKPTSRPRPSAALGAQPVARRSATRKSAGPPPPSRSSPPRTVKGVQPLINYFEGRGRGTRRPGPGVSNPELFRRMLRA